ncbi:MAG: polymer-forming cytoskeletal protein [Myxococcota bacterium]|nr:polymer-forming cytoskeletal protein [Myxococcota bacterium]
MDSAHIISAGVRVDGTVRGAGTLRVAGAVSGAIELDGDVVVERGGEALGAITGTNVEIEGSVGADVTADNGLVVGASGTVQGDLNASTLTIHPDASVKGRVSMRLDLPSRLTGRGAPRGRR